MRDKRLIFLGSAAILAVAGFLAINGYYWWSEFKHPKRPAADTSHSDAAVGSFPSQTSPFPSDWPGSVDGDLPSHALHHESEHVPTLGYFPEHAETVEMAQADVLKDESAASRTPKPKPPRLLPDADLPVVGATESDWLSELVKRELPRASADEIQVWAQELKGLDPEMALGILRMRKNVANGPPAPSSDWPAVPEAPPNGADRLVPPPLDELPADDGFLAEEIQPSIEAFRKARSVILHNLANAHTPGFKRSRIVLSSRQSHTEADPESRADDAKIGRGVELAGALLDVSQGPFDRTGQPLDLAIEGAGFFQVKVGEDLWYTRAGIGAIDERGRLCLINAGKLCPLEPVVQVPEESVSLVISELGQIAAVNAGDGRDSSKTREIGRIQLARFPNAAALEPRGGQLFAPTKISGRPKAGEPGREGFGNLRQGQLELSNVCREEELEAFYRIQSHWQLLRQLSESSPNELVPESIARRSAIPAKRASAVRHKSSPTARPLEMLREGTNLIEEYLQSQRVQSLKRNLGLN